MNIVLNEHEWAESMIRSRSLGQKPSETICRVARYYLDKDYSKKEVRGMLDTFLIQCDPTASLTKWSDTLDYCLNRASKYKAIQIDRIGITQSEMDKINALNGKQIKRLAFTLLCLAKYWDAVNPNGDHWVNTKDSDIMRMANINTSIKRQSAMYADLCREGLISFSKKVDNTNVRVCFSADDSPVVFISDFRSLGRQYLMVVGEPYFECDNCGVVSKYSDPAKGRKQKYCKECAIKVAMQQRVNSVMRKRCEAR